MLNSTIAHPVKIFVVGTEFDSRGGIQCFNRLLLSMLAETARTTPLCAEVFCYREAVRPAAQNAHLDCGFIWHPCAGSGARLVYELARRTLRIKPHVVVFTHVRLLRLARVVRLLSPKTRVFAVAHGAEVWQPLPEGIRRIVRRADGIVTPSRFTAEHLAAQGVDAKRISVVPHGLDPRLVQAQEPVPPKPTRTILSVARLSADDARYGTKGIEHVLAALPRVIERCPDVHYVIAGDGDARPALQATAQRLGVQPFVEFRGELEDAELRRAYREADVFVLPSTLEGFGIVFLEAMFHRLPVVAARAGAAPEVIADGKTGLLVPPGNVEQLASAISGLLLLDDERCQMGEAARSQVLHNYPFATFVRNWQRWLAAAVPGAVYLARQSASYEPPQAIAEQVVLPDDSAAERTRVAHG